MKTLVTGATGFVGGHLVDALLARGDDVTALVRTPAKAADLAARGVRLVQGSLHDFRALDQATGGQEVIFHVAGLVAARDEQEFLRGNREGTRNLLEAAEGSGATRFVLVSSMAAAGPAPRGAPLDTTASAQPVTAYGRSKLAAEQLVRDARIAWSIVRPPMVYGPRDREVLKVFKLVRLGLAPVFGDGSQELSAVYAPDLANALTATADATAAAGGTYFACHPQLFTSAEFVRAVAAAGGKKAWVLPIPELVGRGILALTGAVAQAAGQVTLLNADKANEFFQAAWTGDPASLMRDTGWSAGHDLAAGLAATWEWYRAHGWL